MTRKGIRLILRACCVERFVYVQVIAAISSYCCVVITANGRYYYGHCTTIGWSESPALDDGGQWRGCHGPPGPGSGRIGLGSHESGGSSFVVVKGLWGSGPRPISMPQLAYVGPGRIIRSRVLIHTEQGPYDGCPRHASA